MNLSHFKKKILIFSPAYNVEKKIYSVFERIPKTIFDDNHIEILVINDFSTDKTDIEVEKAKRKFGYNINIHNTERNLGYGGVQKYAFNYSIKNNFDFLIMLHGDGQYAPEELPNFIEKFTENYTLIIH